MALALRSCCSRDDQTTENQRLVLAKVAQHRGWPIVQTYEDQGISGAKGRDQRPAFDTMLKDAVRRRFDVLSHDVELAPGDALEQGIQSRPLVAAPGATDTLVVQPSRPAASWSGCSWFSTVWPRSLVETLT